MELFLGGPHLVKAATGKLAPPRARGAELHFISGVADYFAEDEYML